jgi:hypothetical protein
MDDLNYQYSLVMEKLVVSYLLAQAHILTKSYDGFNRNRDEFYQHNSAAELLEIKLGLTSSK